MRGDLHIHSHYSDGLYSPTEVLRRAKEAGCEVVSLTDHDTFDGVDEANEAAKSLGIKNVTGAEISSYAGTKVHILAYGFNRLDPRFNAFIKELKARRRERAEKILARLADYGMPIPLRELDSCVSREISRPHIALAMVRLGYEKDFITAMRKWLLHGAPTYVPACGVSPEEAVEQIRSAGGLAVLAHPVRIDLDTYEKTALIKRLAAAGLNGIEAVYKRSSRATVKEFKELARSLGLFVTAGADFHADNNEIIARPQNNPIVSL
ncbi:MAG: PHP domain-containing protein [Clostridia bacterium]|nr:PHP domain-containing protein [Clostridia bacterium]